MNDYLKLIKDYICTPREFSNGIDGFMSKKFYITLGLYLTSFVIFAYDPFFIRDGVFTFHQGIVTILLGFIIIAALNWEFLLLGKPAGANLFLQIIQLFPFSLLCARLLAQPSQPLVSNNILSSIKSFIKTSASFMVSWLPEWIADIFKNWQVSIFILFVLLIFCFRPLRVKIGALIFLFFYLLAINIESQPSINLLLGSAILVAGWWLQFCPYSKVIFFENVVAKLRSTPECEVIFLQTVCRIMTRLYESEKASEEATLQIVKAEYSSLKNYSGFEIKVITSEIIRKMLYEYNFIVIKNNGDAMFLYANPNLSIYNGLLSWVSVAPRIMVIFILAVLWVISPIDIIPDAIPVFGVLDDVTISIISAIAIRNSISEIQK